MPTNPASAPRSRSGPTELPRPESRCRRLVGRILGISRLDAIYRELAPLHDQVGSLPAAAIKKLDLRVDYDAELADRIPQAGPVIIVANHPSGGAEGLALAALLAQQRPDYRIMANGVLERYPAFARSIIAVDPFGGSDSMRANLSGMKKAAQHLRAGGAILVFPAGEVAAFNWRSRSIEEATWSDSIARLAIMSQAAVLPIFVTARNSLLFQVAGLLARRLRTALLPRELLRQAGRQIRLRAGRLIPAERIRELGTPGRITAYMRHSTLKLRAAEAPKRRSSLGYRRGRRTFIGDLPIMAQLPNAALRAEFDKIRRQTECGRSGKLSVHLAQAHEIPLLLTEIGRLREISFRAAGEGSGEECDLDAFDNHYQHLFVWDEDRHEIAGAYRLCETEDATGPCDPKRLYTSNLFGYDGDFLLKIGPALELGRSFVAPDYQNDFGTLQLLWKGIGSFVAKNPRYRCLIGAVSMSAVYRDESRELLVAHLNQHHCDLEYLQLLKPNRPFVAKARVDWSTLELGRLTADVRELSALIEDLEPNGQGLPVLWRHYLKLGARVAAFNVDADFANVVDGLIVVNLDEAPMRSLQRYLGSDFAKQLRSQGRPRPLSI